MVRISDAELEVMKIIWEQREVTSLEIIDKLAYCNWNNNTIRTLINRLIAKRAVGISRKEGKVYTYVPLIKEKEYKKKASRNFISQFYNGSVNDLLVNFVKHNEMSKNDLKIVIERVDEKIKKRGER